MSDSQLTLSYQSDPFGGRWDLSSLAPMLKHYVQVKARYPDFKILFQVGDFYEVFFSDAEEVSQTLSIRLTSRNKSDENAVPMCGVPIHALDNYLPKLSAAGLKIVLVSQVSDKPVKREITKVLTPGIRYDGEGLEEHSFNYVASVFANHVGSGFLSYVDVGLGKLRIADFDSSAALADLLERVQPSELILPSSVEGANFDRSAEWLKAASKYTRASITKRAFKPRSVSKVLGEDNYSREEIMSCSALLDYVEELTFGAKLQLSAVERVSSNACAVVDAVTRKNLEIFQGSKTLIEVLDKTLTPMGSRTLKERLGSPLKEQAEIQNRLDSVEYLIKQKLLSGNISGYLAGVRDLERIALRLAGGCTSPPDLANLRDSLRATQSLRELLEGYKDHKLPGIGVDLSELVDKLDSALLEEPNAKIQEGRIFRPGYNNELDRLKELAENAQSELLKLEIKEKAETGINSLRVKFNSVAGYFIEVPKTASERVPERYQRKQTLAQAERYTTEELKKFEADVLSAQSRGLELEKKLFLELREELCQFSSPVLELSKAVGELDCFLSLSKSAIENGYTRPSFTSGPLEIVGGRHPVVETMLPQGRFVSNSTTFSADQRVAVLTGPNMGGKSTYLRQIGLIQIMAQMGSFVSAAEARLPIVDRVFTRIGAADDLSRGESTFMVEMREASAILRRATEGSLVLIDELGRGTATKDGFAIAASILEHLHQKIRCYCVFATHFHDLTELAEKLDGVFCLQVGVVEEESQIFFTHQIREGSADKSYGLEVAKLAGVPKSVLSRAELYLGPTEQISIPELKVQEEHELVRLLKATDVNLLTPLDALSLLSELKQKSEDSDW